MNEFLIGCVIGFLAGLLTPIIWALLGNFRDTCECKCKTCGKPKT